MLTQNAIFFPHPVICLKETGRKGRPPILTEEPPNLDVEVQATLLPISSKTEGARKNDACVPGAAHAHWPWVRNKLN